MNRGAKVFLILLVLMGGGFLALTQTGILKGLMSNVWLDGVSEKATRGDLVIPVTATGTIEAAQYIQVKSKASGIVQSIEVVEGQMVKKGDLLLVLDPVDEQRQVEARQADADRAKSAWEKAKIALEKTKNDLPLQTLSAQARLDDAQGRLEIAKYNFDKIEKMGDSIRSEQEYITAQANLKMANAAVSLAEQDFKTAQGNETFLLNSAIQDVDQAEATYQSTVKQLEDAKQRLTETRVVASKDAMVYAIQTRQGEAVQSGTQSFTGGTPLMILSDISSMFVIAQIDEADIGEISEIAPDYARPGRTEMLEESDYIQRARDVISRNRAEGAPVSKEEESLTLKEAEKKAIEKEGAKVSQARPVEITVDAFRTETFWGVIERILPQPEQITNAVTFKVRVRLVGEDLQRLNGMQADLTFQTETKENVVLVKNEALTSEGRRCFVYIPHKEDASDHSGEKKIEVKIGATDGTFTEIVSGIDEGQAVWIKRPQQTDKEKRESEK